MGFKSAISARIPTKSWFWNIALKSMRYRGASLQLIMAGFNSYIPHAIYYQGPVTNFSRSPIPIGISGNWISIKNLLIPLASKRVQIDTIYRKMESSKLNQLKRNLKLTSIAKSTNSSLLLPNPSHFENISLVCNIEIKVSQISSRIYQNSVPNFNCPLAHAISCIENQIKLWCLQVS